MIELLGYFPDAEPQTPGAMVECTNIVPYEAGMKTAPTPVRIGLPALNGPCLGAAVLRDLTGNARFLAGTSTAIYESNGTAWVDVSQGTAPYSVAASDGWDFAQFGNTALAATPTKRIQRSTSGAFAEITAAPKCHIIESVNGFVMALNTDETVYGTSPDRWWCSALYDDTDWTPAVSTQSTTGRLIDGLGAITAGKRFGSDMIAYKERGIFLGRYAGPPAVWDWTTISEDVGCVGREAVVITNVGHVFVGQDNIYVFDGTRPIPVGDPVRQWWADNSSGQYRDRTKLLWDRQNSLVWMFFPSKTSDGAADYCLVFHTLTRRWGRCDNIAQAVVNFYTSGAFTYDGGSPLISTYNNSPAASIPYDSVLWLNEKEAPAFFDNANQIKALEGESGDSSFTTGDFGSDTKAVMAKRVILNFSQTPDSAECTGYTRPGSGRTLTERSTSELNDSAFDMRQTARFHRFQIDISGNAKFNGIEVEVEDAGVR